MPHDPHAPDDRFAPPGGGPADDLALADIPARKRAPLEETPLAIPAPRKPVVYKKPGGGGFVLWLFAAIGLAAVVGGAAMFFKRAEPASPARPAAPPPPKPIVWKSVAVGDQVLLTVEVAPRGARLMLDGTPIPSNPAHVARGSHHTIDAVADGYQTATQEVVADGPTTVKLKLKREGR